jgi:VIT1/CCC1 family predicted Fe2+/Mn2+ transporter
MRQSNTEFLGVFYLEHRSLAVEDHTQRMITILLVILVLMLLGAIPTWPHSRSWGYAPSGGLTLVVVILLILMLMGRL